MIHMKAMTMRWTVFFLLSAVPSHAVWSRTAPSTFGDFWRSLALLQGRKGSDPHALQGDGGGIPVLADMMDDDKGKKEEVYREWKTRFEQHPYDLDKPTKGDPYFLKEENRMSYRRYYEANPNLALAPNSRDRSAQSTVEVMFGLTALGTVLCGILVVNGFNFLDATSLDSQTYQRLVFSVILFVSAPWLILGVWLLTLFASGLANPMRDAQLMHYSWQCSALAWFLLVAALVNTAYFTVHGLWISKLFYNIESQPLAPMGRMFFQPADKQAKSDDALGLLDRATCRGCRMTLFILELVCAMFGAWLVSFRGGVNSQLCQPEVYWAANALIVTALILVVITALAFVFSIIIGVYSTSAWVQDFFGSFWEARQIVKLKKAEERQEKVEVEWREQRKADTEANANFDESETQDFEDMHKEDWAKHSVIMAEHERYVADSSQEPPRRFEPPTISTGFEEDDKPLVVWEDEEEPPELAVTGVTTRPVQLLPPVVIPSAPPSQSYVSPLSVTMHVREVSPRPTYRPASPVVSAIRSMSSVQMPATLMPGSMPVITTSQMMPATQMPTESTIYTAPETIYAAPETIPRNWNSV